MTQHNLTQILKVIRDFVMRNRPCYRDYLGSETVTKTVQIGSSVFVDNKGIADTEFRVTDSAFAGFILGETYTVAIDGVAEDYIARVISPISDEVGPVIGTTTTVDMENNTFDGWMAMAALQSGAFVCLAQTFDTSFVGKTISISQTKTETVKRYNTKLLPEYLLPTFLRKNVVATKTEVQRAAEKATAAASNAQSTANAVQSAANAAYVAANGAQLTANTAKSTADEAKTKAINAYTKASIAETTAQNAVSFTTTQSLTDTEKKTARDNIGAGVPDGGTVGQLLGKTETGTAWIDPPQSGVQPDWNQNDSTQPDYVKNRPFYTGNPVETVLVEEITASFVLMDGQYVGHLESTFSPTVGETYKVSWDGTIYECTCVNFEGISAVGNLSLMGAGSDTGEPFLMLVSNGVGIDIGTTDASASHTFSISGTAAPIVKIPAKYIDKNSSGYVFIHRKDTMTQQEAENYIAAISAKEVVFIIWGIMCISKIGFGGTTSLDLQLKTQNGEFYFIKKNADGLFAFSDREFDRASFPSTRGSRDRSPSIEFNEKKIQIIPGITSVSVGSTDVLFRVQPDGTKSKAFDVLGNGEAVAPALILYSSTANSTKKFRITVDDSGTVSATEVT